MEELNAPVPLVFFVIGSTGSRKTVVAVELAKKLQTSYQRKNVVVVNCDVSQLYEDLPIATNKGSAEEFSGIPHFFLGFLSSDGKKKYDPQMPYPHCEEPLVCVSSTQKYNITSFQHDVALFIENHFKQNDNTAVIVCGGTCYYSQAILFSNTLMNDDCVGTVHSEEIEDRVELWNRLHRVDPDVASRYHPHDTRRIQRLLQIYDQEGELPSKLFSSKSVNLRFPHSYVIWTYIEREELKVMLSKRVDVMLEKGLLSEVNQFHQKCLHTNNEGSILESIGYKEFLPYLKQTAAKDDTYLKNAIELVKSNTWRYARQQLQFIKNRFIPLIRLTGINDPWRFVRYNASCSENITRHLEVYLENVLQKKNASCSVFSFPLCEEAADKGEVTQTKCTICDMIVCGRGQMEVHMESKRHRGALKRMRLEKEQLEKYGRVLPPKKRKT